MNDIINSMVKKQNQGEYKRLYETVTTINDFHRQNADLINQLEYENNYGSNKTILKDILGYNYTNSFIDKKYNSQSDNKRGSYVNKIINYIKKINGFINFTNKPEEDKNIINKKYLI